MKNWGKVVLTVFVFWHASAIPISQISVFSPNPRLAKLSIAAVEPIDEVERQGCRFGLSLGPDLRLAHFGGIGGERVKGSFRPLLPRVSRGNNTLSIMFRQAGPRS